MPEQRPVQSGLAATLLVAQERGKRQRTTFAEDDFSSHKNAMILDRASHFVASRNLDDTPILASENSPSPEMSGGLDALALAETRCGRLSPFSLIGGQIREDITSSETGTAAPTLVRPK